MTSKYTFVLVHGSWHDGSLWADVARFLRRSGHTVHTPTIAGHGPHADPATTHAGAVDSIVDYVQDRDLTDIVMVGHSFGGTILTQAAPRIITRLRRLVFQNAFVVEDGNSLNDELPGEYVQLFADIKDPQTGTIMLPFDIWRENFIQDADLKTATDTYDQLTPEPGAMFDTPLDQAAFFSLVVTRAVPMSYINATTDIALPHGRWGWYPRFARRLGFPRVIEADGSHELMFSDPRHLARIIVEAGRD
jgi:pimeloyl-ACP methyl ester carboxylesterase